MSAVRQARHDRTKRSALWDATTLSVRSHRAAVVEPLEERRLFATLGYDPTFGGGDGVAPLPLPARSGSVTLPDGRMIVGGARNNDEDSFRIAVMMLRTDGTLDTSFGGGDGIAEIEIPFNMNDRTVESFETIAIAPSTGKITLGTRVTPLNTGGTLGLFLARFNADGTADNTFSNDGVVTELPGSDVQDVLIQPDGKTLVLGESNLSEMSLTRLNVNGSLDTSFGGSGTGTISRNVDVYTYGAALGLASDGRIYAAGSVSSDNFVNIALFKYTTAGLIDTSFGGGSGFVLGDGGVSRDMVVEPSGSLVILGDAYPGDAVMMLQRFTASGTPTTYGQFNAGQNRGNSPAVDTLAIYDGKFYVTGGLHTFQSYPYEDGMVLRFNSNLTPDTTFNDPPAPGHASNYFVYERHVVQGYGYRFINVGPTGRVTVLDDDGVYAFSYGGDDTIASALPISIGTTVEGEVFDNTDVAMRRFTVSAGQRIGFDLDRPGLGTLDSYLRLFDASGREIAFNDNAPAPGEASGGVDSYLDYTFVTGGTYYLGISGAGNNQYSSTTGNGTLPASAGRFNLTTSVLALEANGRIASASPLRLNSTRFATISDPTDIDVYAINVVAGQRVFLDVDANGSNLNGYLRLFNANGTQLTYNDNRAAPGEGSSLMPYVDYTFATAGTYYVAISGYGNNNYNVVAGNGYTPSATLGAYSLVVTLPVTSTTPLSLNTTVRASIDAPTEIDYFAITVTAGQRIAFDMDSEGSKLNAYLRVFSPEWRQLAYNDNRAAPGEGSSLMPYIEYTFATAGTYYVGISGYPNTNYNPLTGLGITPGSVGYYALVTSVL